MPVLPMFPLGSVLFPAMPLRLRVFEERYLIMLSELVKQSAAAGRAVENGPKFGVVLIERGFEVGGGQHRFGTGTIAEIVDIGAHGDIVGLSAHGTRRFEVVEWLTDDPYPRAEVQELPDLVWEERLEPLRHQTEALVRRTLAMASEFTDDLWSADLELSPDPVAAAWQLAAIAPVGELDQIRLVRCATMTDLLTAVAEVTTDAAVGFQAS